jgi:hypothetical protein
MFNPVFRPDGREVAVAIEYGDERELVAYDLVAQLAERLAARAGLDRDGSDGTDGP